MSEAQDEKGKLIEHIEAWMERARPGHEKAVIAALLYRLRSDPNNAEASIRRRFQDVLETARLIAGLPPSAQTNGY